jgi:hypothetical protein
MNSFAAMARPLLLCIAVVTLSACGGGGGDDGGTGNRAPVASAGGDQVAVELVPVQLSGSGSDPDAGDTLTFSWSQTGGTNVTLNNATTANADFVAPDVAAGVPEVLTFQLTVTDAAGLASSDTVEVTVQEPAAAVTISGIMQYEFPPPNAGCNGLNFGNIQLRPIRQATVQVLDDSGTNVLDSDVTDDLGAYSVTVNASTNVILRVRAEIKQAGTPSWDVEVRNNVVDPADPNPPALDQRPIYVMDTAPMDSGMIDQTVDLTAPTGWDGAAYTNPRVAAPFAVLDAIYNGILLVVAEDPNANFAPLDAFWSPANSTTTGSGTFDERVDSGELGTSFYSGDRLFLLGMDGDDAEEFDDHVIVHEWGHYFEDNFSRSDSPGGAHSVGDLLDMRVAFGEGFATALSGMALNNSSYCDTMWFGGNLSGFEIDIESEAGGTSGWFNEMSVMKLIYDLWDTDADPGGADDSSIGFGPIFDVMTGPQAVTSAFTSIFSFATELKLSLNDSDNTFVDALLAEQDINPIIDIWGSTETNDGPGTPDDVLPIYEDLVLGATKSICTNNQFDSGRDGNKLSEHRYLRLNLPVAQPVTFTMTTNPAPTTPPPGFDCTVDPDDPESHTHSDPDFIVWQNGDLVWFGLSCEPNSEVTTTNGALPAGDYVIGLNEFRQEDEDTIDPLDNFARVCFDFTAN